MRIVMFGAGAMGGIYGGLLALNGCDVTFVDTFIHEEFAQTLLASQLKIVAALDPFFADSV